MNVCLGYVMHGQVLYFHLILVGLHFAQFSLNDEELVLLNETEVHLLRGFQLCQRVEGRGKLARITDGMKQFRPQGHCPNKTE